MPTYFGLQPARIEKLNLPVARTTALGDVKAAPLGFAANIEASHKAVTTLLDYLAKLHLTPTGVMPDTEKHAGAWKAVQATTAVLRQTEDKMRAEAKDLADEYEAEALAFWKSHVPNQAMHARVYEMAERYVGKGEVENLRAMMNDPQVAAVIALSPRELVHPQFGHATRDGLVRSVLHKALPDLKLKSDNAADLMDLADGHKAVWRDVMYGVTSEKAASAHASRPADPVIEAAA